MSFGLVCHVGPMNDVLDKALRGKITPRKEANFYGKWGLCDIRYVAPYKNIYLLNVMCRANVALWCGYSIPATV